MAIGGSPTPALAACAPAGGPTVTCSDTTTDQNAPDGFGDGTQSGFTIDVRPGATVTGIGNDGLRLDRNNTVNNSGIIDGQGNAGISGNGPLTVNNAAGGVIRGATYGVYGDTDATVINAGSIFGGAVGININNAGTVINWGTISGQNGIAVTQGNVTNTGTIQADRYGVFFLGTSTLINSGTIIGGPGWAAIATFGAGNDVLTFLPGSRIVGDIILANNSTINIRTGGDIAWLMRFGICGCGGITDTGSRVVFSGGSYGVVTGNRIATIDPTAFASADRTLTDVTAMLSSLIDNRLAAPPSATTAFASTASSTVAGANDAFAHIPSLAYANEGRIAHAASYDRASGIGVWSRGFAGLRHQNADGPTLAADTTTYGGMVGLDKIVAPGLRFGAYVGAGVSRLGVERNSQTVKTDYLFGGVYGRKTWNTQFLDVTLSAGKSSNRSERLIASNAAASGFETAIGSYDGWFVSPELVYGMVMPLGDGFTVTPSVHLRYVAGHFGGYSEAGSTQTLSVAGRTAHNLEQRAQLAVSRTVAGFRTTLTAGAVAVERVGGTTIDTVLIGQPLSFAAPGNDTAGGGYAGLAFDWNVGAGASLFAAVQGTLMSDNSRSVLAQGGVRVAF